MQPRLSRESKAATPVRPVPHMIFRRVEGPAPKSS
jgi:hypothetical protein